MMTLKYGPKQREEKAREVFDRIYNFVTTNGYVEWVERLKLFDHQWRAVLPRDHKPWEHASEYNPLLTYSKVEDVHAVLFGFISTLDFFSMAASQTNQNMEDEMKQRAEDWTNLLRWSMHNETNTTSFFDRFTHNGCLYGCSFGMLTWKREERPIQAEIFIDDDLRRSEDSDLSILMQGLETMLVKDTKPSPRGDGTFDIRFIDEDGVEKDGVAWVDTGTPGRDPEEKSIIVERNAVFYDAPKPRIVLPWDMLVPADTYDLQSARRFWHRQWMSYQEIFQLYKSNIFNGVTQGDLKVMREKAAQKVPDTGQSVGGPGTRVSDARDTEMGADLQKARRQLYEVFWEYAYEPRESDGRSVSIVRAVVRDKAPILLMEQRLEYLFPHGRRPFFDWHYEPVDDRYYGRGIPEILQGSQREANGYYQARADMLEIITKPSGFYDPMSTLAPNILRLTPGMMVKSRNPQAAFTPLAFPHDPTFLLREQSGMEAEAERGIGSTDMGLGRAPSRPNAPRTLGGTAIVVRQQQLRMDVPLKRLLIGSSEATGGVVEFIQQYHELYAALMPPVKQFRTVGTEDIRTVNRQDLQGRFDLIVDIGQEINNPQLRLQNATLRYQNSMTNPLVLQDPMAVWRLTTDFWEATGIRGAKRWLMKPQGAPDHPPMTQEEENGILARGVFIEPLQTDDHARHLADIAALIQDPYALREQGFSNVTIALLNRHAQRHFELAAAATSGALSTLGPGGPAPSGNGGGPSQPGGLPPVRLQGSMLPYGTGGGIPPAAQGAPAAESMGGIQ